ncbi:hypothetical protein [Butyrivibrio fibrisolvens]|jgi:uncharacterized membrane protein|uniref:hypothetical protein n=1 Tax=Butyrivibrio fibrisolvens TaxID=831 RepID=UPI0004159176|nr:hypothetical protein [Butyrivibrio fibrisolvens]
MNKRENGLGCFLIVLATVITAVEYFIFLAIRDNSTLFSYVTPMAPYNLILVIASLVYVAGFTIIDIKKDFGYVLSFVFGHVIEKCSSGKK